MRRIWAWLGVLGVSVFCGLIMIAVALGAVFPKLVNPIATPLVCPNGHLDITQNTTTYRAGESDTWTTDTCVDSANGQTHDVSLQTTFAAGMIYSLIIAAIIAVWSVISRVIFGRSKTQNPHVA